MIQTQENGEKPHFGPNLGQLGPIGRAIFLFIFFFYFYFFKNLASPVTRKSRSWSAIIMYNIRKD